jgi:putative redox protein
MKTQIIWNEKMTFAAPFGEAQYTLDAKKPIGREQGPTPKEMLLSAISGCTAMDVIGLLTKHKQLPEKFEVTAEAGTTKTHPIIFDEVKLTFAITGASTTAETFIQAITLSQTRYCGVSAMVAATVPIKWTAVLNGTVVGEGKADFKEAQAAAQQ